MARNHLPDRRDNGSSANLGFERDLWRLADALRSNMDAAEYRHVVLGPIVLRYISGAFDQRVTVLTHRNFAACYGFRSLPAIRDALLPKLVSGEIRVRRAAGRMVTHGPVRRRP